MFKFETFLKTRGIAIPSVTKTNTDVHSLLLYRGHDPDCQPAWLVFVFVLL